MILRIFNVIGLTISCSIFLLALIVGIKKGNGDGVFELIAVVALHLFAIFSVATRGMSSSRNRIIQLYDVFWPFIFLFVVCGLWLYWHYHQTALNITYENYIAFIESKESRDVMEAAYKENLMMIFEHIWYLVACFVIAVTLPLVGIYSSRFTK